MTLIVILWLGGAAATYGAVLPMIRSRETNGAVRGRPPLVFRYSGVAVSGTPRGRRLSVPLALRRARMPFS